VRRDGVEFYRNQYPAMAKFIHFLPTWVDEEVFYPYNLETRFVELRKFARKHGFHPQEKLILFVGRLDGQKDPLLLVDSFRYLCGIEEKVRLLIVGSGPLERETKDRVKFYGLEEKVEFINYLPQQELARLMRICHSLVLTSAFEGMPRSVIEALACGLPVVTTDVGEVKRVVKNNFSGIVCKNRSPEAITKALLKVLGGGFRPGDCVLAVKRYRARDVLNRVYSFYESLSRVK